MIGPGNIQGGLSVNFNPYMKGIGSNAKPQGHRFFTGPQQSSMQSNAMSPTPQWMNQMFGGNNQPYSNPNISGTVPGLMGTGVVPQNVMGSYMNGTQDPNDNSWFAQMYKSGKIMT